MSEVHTEEIVKSYFKDTGYSVSAFEKAWGAKTESFTLSSALGHTIPVTYICPNGIFENKTIILVHWHEANQKAMYPIAEEFLKRGWNVVLYDQRSHGKNSAKTVTFGHLESKDLQDVAAFASEKTNGAVLGALGQSMGAATVAYYSGTDHARRHLDFAVVDSAYSSMYEEIAYQISLSKIPLPSNALASLGSAYCKLLYGFRFSNADIAGKLRSNGIPTLVMHSKADTQCPYSMGEMLYTSIPHSSKKLVTFASSEHLFSFWDEPERYMQSVFSFIDQYKIFISTKREIFMVTAITKDQIVSGLRALGVKPGFALEVHSSLRSFGYVEGGAETVIEALKDAVGGTGAIVMPSFRLSPDYPLTEQDKKLGLTLKIKILQEDEEPSRMGIVSETFRKMPGVRTGKGIFRVSAWGRDAAEHAASGFQRLIDMDGWALLLGVDIHSLSSMHYVEVPARIEEKFKAPEEAQMLYPPEEWFIEAWKPACDPWGIIQRQAYAKGYIAEGRIGTCKCMLMKIQNVIGLYREALQTDPIGLYGLSFARDL